MQTRNSKGSAGEARAQAHLAKERSHRGSPSSDEPWLLSQLKMQIEIKSKSEAVKPVSLPEPQRTFAEFHKPETFLRSTFAFESMKAILNTQRMYRSVQGQLGPEITRATELELMRLGCSRWPLPLHNQSLPILVVCEVFPDSPKPGPGPSSEFCPAFPLLAALITWQQHCVFHPSFPLSVGPCESSVALGHLCITSIKHLNKVGTR